VKGSLAWVCALTPARIHIDGKYHNNAMMAVLVLAAAPRALNQFRAAVWLFGTGWKGSTPTNEVTTAAARRKTGGPRCIASDSTCTLAIPKTSGGGRGVSRFLGAEIKTLVVRAVGSSKHPVLLELGRACGGMSYSRGSPELEIEMGGARTQARGQEGASQKRYLYRRLRWVGAFPEVGTRIRCASWRPSWVQAGGYVMPVTHCKGRHRLVALRTAKAASHLCVSFVGGISA
jgi:hypothetical protein